MPALRGGLRRGPPVGATAAATAGALPDLEGSLDDRGAGHLCLAHAGSVGLRTVPATCDRRYPTIELSEDVLRAVELVLFSTEPFPFKERHLTEFRALHPSHANKAATIDAQMVSWYGSRAVRGLAYLAEFALAHA